MSSSDETGGVREAAAEEPEIAPASAASAASQDDGVADPWFAPGPKVAAAESVPELASDGSEQAHWFLPSGRAGLLPDSMTESWDDDAAGQAGRTEAAGDPPWERAGAGDAADAARQPPPWENGAWSGPGSSAAGPAAQAADDDVEAVSERRQRSRLIIVGGAAVVALAVAIVVIVLVTSGGSTAGCATYPASVRQAYARAMSDISGHAPASVQAADLGRAAGLANASAAAAGQLPARTALFAMASDLDEGYSDVTNNRPLTSDLQQRLTADGTALPQSCPG